MRARTPSARRVSRYLLMQLMVTAVASVAGVWLFYVQHQFEDVSWERKEDWDFARAAALADPGADDALRAAARATVLEKYDLHSVCLPRQIDLVERAAGPAFRSDRRAVTGL